MLTADELRRVEAVLLPEGIDSDDGALSWRVNASLAATIFDTFEALDHEVYNRKCAHSLANRLLPNVTTARTITLLAIDNDPLKAELNQLIPADIAAIEDLQLPDGGWAWCSSPNSNPWFTAYVLLALDKAAEAGFSPAIETTSRAIVYLNDRVEQVDRLSTNEWEANRQAFFLYVLSETDQAKGAEITQLVSEKRNDLDSYAKALLVQALAITGGETETMQNLLSDLSGEAQVSATGAHWEDDDYANLSSDIRATAMALSAFAAS